MCGQGRLNRGAEAAGSCSFLFKGSRRPYNGALCVQALLCGDEQLDIVLRFYLGQVGRAHLKRKQDKRLPKTVVDSVAHGPSPSLGKKAVQSLVKLSSTSRTMTYHIFTLFKMG